eukprot:146092-Hanusia_phi.AAC.1
MFTTIYELVSVPARASKLSTMSLAPESPSDRERTVRSPGWVAWQAEQLSPFLLLNPSREGTEGPRLAPYVVGPAVSWHRVSA